MHNQTQTCALRALSIGDQVDDLDCLALPCVCEIEQQPFIDEELRGGRARQPAAARRLGSD